MKFIEITTPDTWDMFQRQHPWAQFTQSWTWGEFRRNSGCNVRRFALLDDHGNWLLAAQLEYRKKMPGIGYWYAPRGPVFWSERPPGEDQDLLREFFHGLKDMDLRSAFFMRFEPVLKNEGEIRHILPEGIRRAPQLNPACTLLLDLSKNETELLAGMHQKTRYNIRVAERHGIRIRLANSATDLESFLVLMKETSSRDQFIQHDASYLRATYKALQGAKMGRLRFAESEGKVLAASLEVMYGDTLTYLYGASSSEGRHRMAPFALHWAAIREAKQEGYRLYDFWGVNPHTRTSPAYKTSWEGISRFKRGWGGEEVSLLGTWDLPRYPRLYSFVFRHG